MIVILYFGLNVIFFCLFSFILRELVFDVFGNARVDIGLPTARGGGVMRVE